MESRRDGVKLRREALSAKAMYPNVKRKKKKKSNMNSNASQSRKI